jgi:hypothetical protein
MRLDLKGNAYHLRNVDRLALSPIYTVDERIGIGLHSLLVVPQRLVRESRAPNTATPVVQRAIARGVHRS